ncbi:hypothetical protein Y1Q_0016528 [Alligator mississippiensis]|uniref:Uncharacterized protein n=1 Tax=Alligator mississippiensis TaxID=8496 RepID=A0A151N349_ALLMI|nr:hypothetical protein Y1Q_0016528 [Alligator mississippiensis]
MPFCFHQENLSSLKRGNELWNSLFPVCPGTRPLFSHKQLRGMKADQPEPAFQAAQLPIVNAAQSPALAAYHLASDECCCVHCGFDDVLLDRTVKP